MTCVVCGFAAGVKVEQLSPHRYDVDPPVVMLGKMQRTFPVIEDAQDP
jgi:hypothetical protein